MNPSRFEVLEHPGPIAFAHRGGAAERPENTWASFGHAYELGFRYMETDAHSTSDGVAVAIHDPDMSRVGGPDKPVRETTWAELSRIRLDGDQAIPRIDELLGSWPDVRWNIDAKHETSVAPLVETLLRCDALARVCVSSFSDRRLTLLRKALGPRLCTAMGPAAVAALRAASFLPDPIASPTSGPLGRFGAAQVPTHQARLPLVDQRFVRAAHGIGVQVHVWTVDEESEMERLLDLGVDGIMTDRPSTLKRVYESRGIWP